jgi:Holliday junction resolvase-like predicted endonuclease
MRLTAELYLAQHPELPQEGRIDLVAVSLSRNGLVMSIDLIENAVEGHA